MGLLAGLLSGSSLLWAAQDRAVVVVAKVIASRHAWDQDLEGSRTYQSD